MKIAKQKKTKKEKKPSLAKLKKIADKLWSLIVRHVGHCEVCGKTEHLNAHHFVTRRCSNLRWNVDNGVCVCPSCHLFSVQSFHKNPLFAFDFLNQVHPAAIPFLIAESKAEPKEINIEDMQHIIAALSDLLGKKAEAMQAEQPLQNAI